MRRKACLVLFILSFLLLFVSCGSSSERDKSNDSVSSVTSVEKKSESSESNESKKDDEQLINEINTELISHKEYTN